MMHVKLLKYQREIDILESLSFDNKYVSDFFNSEFAARLQLLKMTFLNLIAFEYMFHQ